MTDQPQRIFSDYLTPPGTVLGEELDARALSYREFASRIGCTRQALSELIDAHRPLTPELACAVALAFGTSARLWLGLEERYREGLARQAHRAKGRPSMSGWVPQTPLKDHVPGG